MKFSELCDMAENTEQEQQLLQYFRQDGMEDVEQVFAKLARIPILGKIFTALIAMGDCESIAQFRRTRHYRSLMNWDFDIDFEQRNLQINASDEQKQKIMKIATAISAGIALAALAVICRKLCRRRR